MSIKEIYQTMEYGPAPESNKESVAFLDSHKRKFSLFINGKWTKPSSGEYFESFSPATTQKLAQIAEANEKDVDDAVKAAKKALKALGRIGWTRQS
jgi:aldehyde dehydrogenase (NAD+)